MATLTIILSSTSTPLGAALPSTGQQDVPPIILADYIDPSTRDFASMLSTLDQIDAQVIIALSTQRGSGASVQEIGTKLREIKKITEYVEIEIKAEIVRALKLLTNNGDILLEPVVFDEVDKTNQTIQVSIKWKNVRAGTKASVRLLLEVSNGNA